VSVLNRTSILVIAAVAYLACGDSESPPSKLRPERPSRDAGAELLDGDVEDAEIAADAGDGRLVLVTDCKAKAPRSCPDPSPRWADVYPIFMQHCVSCHNGAGEQWPLNAYEHVADWYGEIRAQMLACTMPPVDSGIEMPLEDRQTILSWIRCDFPK
jgi:hypothetical protein